MEGGLSAAHSFDVWTARRVRIWSGVSSELRRTSLLQALRLDLPSVCIGVRFSLVQGLVGWDGYQAVQRHILKEKNHIALVCLQQV